MDDCIEREALLQSILDLPPKMDEDGYGWLGRRGVWQMVLDFPAADVRPVVLCRDCKYFSEVMYGGTQFEYGYCDRWADGTRMNPDDFCSRAAKKED